MSSSSQIPEYLLPAKKTGKWNQFCEYGRWFFWQILLTFTAQESFFSSKRIERMVIFLNANIWLDLIINHLINVGKLDYLGAVAIYSAQMVYAGFQTKQIFNDMKIKKEEDTGNSFSSNTTTTTTENSSTVVKDKEQNG